MLVWDQSSHSPLVSVNSCYIAEQEIKNSYSILEC